MLKRTVPYLIADLGTNWRTDPHSETKSINNLARWIDGIDPTVVPYLKLQVWDTDAMVDDTKYPSTAVAKLRQYEWPKAWTKWFVGKCAQQGITPMVTPLDLGSVQHCIDAGFQHWKVASGDLTWQPLHDALAATGQPIWLSTGNGTMTEVSGAVGHLRARTKAPITVLHCVPKYPTKPNECGWARLGELKQLTTIYQDVSVGWSSHVALNHATYTNLVASLMGAACIELHIRPSGVGSDSPDYWHSLSWRESQAMHRQMTDVLSAVGTQPTQDPEELKWARRSADGRRPNLA